MALIAFGGIAWRWGPEKWERAKLLYWQWRCMNYSPPPDEIVYDQVPNGRSALLNGSSKYVAVTEHDFVQGSTTAAAMVPDCEDHFAKNPLVGGSGFQPPIVFMHDRAAPSGRHYLVILRGDSIPFLQIGRLPLDFEAFKTGDWREGPEDASGVRPWSGPVSVPVRERIRIYAGQADPADPTHFTVRYTEDGNDAVADGYVDDYIVHGDFVASVKLTARPAN
jgi:hypothetical protein